MIAWILLACSPSGGGADDSGVDLGEPAPELVLPDLSGVDVPAAFVDALALATTITASSAWTGHVQSLGRRSEGCPDFYVGPIEEAELDEGSEAITWLDYCNTQGTAFGGFVSWEGNVQVQGALEAPEGRTVDATRRLSGDGLVATEAGAAFELEGEASETVYQVEAADYQRWTWSSLVDATVTGSDAFGSAEARGWRADLYLAAAGGSSGSGDAPTLELRGNAFLFEPRIADRFDSFDADLSFGTDLDCTLEPRGWISLRESDAFWYDLVFLPLEDGKYTNPGYEECDGCGTLFVRGVEAGDYEATELGPICPDFSGTWQIPADRVPDPATFLLPLREILTLEGA